MAKTKAKRSKSLWRQSIDRRMLFFLLPACIVMGVVVANIWASSPTTTISTHVYAIPALPGPEFEVKNYPVQISGYNDASTNSIKEYCNGHNVTNGRSWTFRAPARIKCTANNAYYMKAKSHSGYKIFNCSCGAVNIKRQPAYAHFTVKQINVQD
jgi:hypothetical protein